MYYKYMFLVYLKKNDCLSGRITLKNKTILNNIDTPAININLYE